MGCYISVMDSHLFARELTLVLPNYSVYLTANKCK